MPDARRGDQQWAIWARKIPGGWAGGPHYLEAAPGPPTILLRDTTQKVAAIAALDSILQLRYPGFSNGNAPVGTRQARWDLAELYDWKEYIVANFSRARGTTINGWGVSNRKNAVEIGIEKRETLRATMEWLHEINVPCRLVTVMVMGQVVLPVRVGDIRLRPSSPKRPPRN